MYSGYRTNSTPGSHYAHMGRSHGRYNPTEYDNYIRNMYHRLTNEYERRRPQEVPQTRPAGPAPPKVELVELYASQNAQEHHTDMYELVQMQPPTTILRRGNAFYMAIRFAKRPFDSNTDTLRLTFNFGPHPNIAKGTKAELLVSDNKEFTKGKASWDVRVHHQVDSTVTLHIQIPASVCVGLWRCEIVTSLKENNALNEKYSIKDSIYILFNPWCKEDGVYMEEQDRREEYVLSDVGKVYVGSFHNPRGAKWVFGQFDDVVLPACMFILEKSKLDFTARGNPVKVVRAISAIVNSIDDDGILEGRWDGNYKDGKSPQSWTGSVKILEEYMKNQGKSVKYGQCWVFSGLTTTICRALGIACRSVTNFVSAHDTDETLTIDKYFDAGGNELDDETSDSIWNFHVWNDVWMARPDLPIGYGGWQAIDATPQEQSEALYQAGPASLTAVRRGEIGFLYDTPFIFSEVNADLIHWQEDDQSLIGYKKMKTNKYHIGRCLFTKKCNHFDDYGEDDALDIMDEYKNKEGTDAERLTVLNAARAGGMSHIYDMPTPENEDVYFDLIEIDRITIGEPFQVKVHVLNKSEKVRNVYAILSTSSVYYTGVQAKRVKKVDANFKLEPRQEEELSIHIKCEDYLDKLVDYSMMKIYAIAFVRETNQTWTEEDDFAVDKPQIQLDTKGPLQVGKEFSLICSFTNPLSRLLQDCRLMFEGPGLSKPKTVYIKNVGPNETVQHTERFTPVRAGERKIIVNFESNFLNEISGSKTIQVAA